MVKYFDSVISIMSGRVDWNLQVRVVRLWKTYSKIFPHIPRSIEIVLIDISVSIISLASDFPYLMQL